MEASEKFCKRLACGKTVVLLGNAGQYPMETPGLYQMCDAIADFVRSM